MSTSNNLDSVIISRDVLQSWFNDASKHKEVESPLYTREKVMQIFDICSQTLNNWEDRSLVKPVKVGRRVYYRKVDIDILIGK